MFALGKLIFILLAIDSIIRSLDVAQNVADVVSPLDAGVGHTVVDLGCLTEIAVASLLSNLHGPVEVLGARIVVLLLSEDLTELHEGTALTLSVLELAAELKVSLNEHLELLGIHLSVHLVASNLTEVTNGDGLTSNTRHLNGVAKRELVVDRRFFVVTCLVVDDTQVDVSEELSSDIGNFLMSGVVVNGVAIEGRFSFTELHIVNTDAVIGESFTVNISDGFTDLEELLVRLDGQLELSKVIV